MVQSRSIYTHVVHVWNTKTIVKGLQRELINYSTVTIHRQVYDLVSDPIQKVTMHEWLNRSTKTHEYI